MKIYNPSLQNTEITGSISLTDSVTGSLLTELTSSFDVRYPSITLFNEYTQSVNSTTGSSNDRLDNIESFSGSINSKFDTLGNYTSSIDSKFETLATYTGSNDTINLNQNSRLDQLSTHSGSAIGRLNNLETFSGSVNTKFETLSTYTSSNDSKFSTLESYTSSVDSKFSTLSTYTGSNDTTNTTQNSRLDQLSTQSGSTIGRLNNIESFSGSINSKFDTLATYTGSNDTTNTTQNSRLDLLSTFSASADSRLTNIESNTGSYSRTDTNNSFSGLQTFNDINVNGTASFAYIQSTTGSSTSIGEAFIVLNENVPSSNFAGIKIIDSGSGFATSSFMYDGLNNQWIFQHTGSPKSGSSMTIFGPLSQGGLGTEVGLTENKVPKAITDHGHHIGDSNITDSGTLITLGSDTVITGTIVATGAQLVSGSSQITYPNISNIPTNIVSASTDSTTVDFTITDGNITANLIGGVVSGSEQVVGILSSLNSYTSSNDTTNTTQNSRLDQLSTQSGSTIGRLNNIESFSGSINSKFDTLSTYSGSIDTKFNTLATYTGSNDTTNTNQNDRLDQLSTQSGSAVSRLNNIESFTSSISTTIKNQLDANTVISSSAQLTTEFDSRYLNTNGDNVVSGSSQISYTGISNIPIGIISGSSQITPLLPTGTVSGSSQISLRCVTGCLFSNNNFTFPQDLQVDGDLQTFTMTNTSTAQFNGEFIVLGQSRFGTGSVSTPGISVTGDTNTGIYFPAEDTIGFVEGGNQAMTINSLGTVITSGSLVVSGSLLVQRAEELVVTASIAATGTINYDILSQSVLYYTANATNNWTLNLRGNASNSLNNIMTVGRSLTVVFMVTNGVTPYKQTALQIDGGAITPRWQGGAQASGSASSVDSYTIVVMKTGNASYSVFESITQFK